MRMAIRPRSACPPASCLARRNHRRIPNIFTAVQEQPGLKLESGRSPVEVMVIVGTKSPAG
jgi:uncharacterized protein (TIGR03435 family)